MSSQSTQLAALLSGAWRLQPPDVGADIDEVTLEHLLPLLLGASLAPLAWWRIRHTALSDTRAGRKLHRAFSRQALSTALQEAHIERIVLHLRGASVEPLLLKGWASARLYPHAGLRPLGDIDLLVPAEQGPRAEAAIAMLPLDESHPYLDVKAEIPSLYEREESSYFKSSCAAPLRSTWVSVLAPEEHLRMLCLHFLRHGAWRALWLCDIAALVEGRSPCFDWDRCLRGSRHAADWIACAVGLAHALVGADIEGTPFAKRLPSWMAPSVLRVWQARRYYQDYQIGSGTALGDAWPNPMRVAAVLRERWPNPIEVSLFRHGTIDRIPTTAWPVLSRQFLLYTQVCTRFVLRGGRRGGLSR